MVILYLIHNRSHSPTVITLTSSLLMPLLRVTSHYGSLNWSSSRNYGLKVVKPNHLEIEEWKKLDTNLNCQIPIEINSYWEVDKRKWRFPKNKTKGVPVRFRETLKDFFRYIDINEPMLWYQLFYYPDHRDWHQNYNSIGKSLETNQKIIPKN